jgi:hypothetical protein
MIKNTLRISALSGLLVILGSFSAQSYSQENARPVQKGMCYATWDKNKFASSYSDQSLEELSKTGAEYIAICPTYYQQKRDTTRIFPTEQSPTDSSVIHAIKKAQELGMKVLLKPHIDLVNGTTEGYWRADIGFTDDEDWIKWFGEYQKFILHFAEIAEALNVELFCVGTELAFTTQKDTLWRERVISKVREVYSGKLIYAANWDNYQAVRFWDKLDYIGIDAYFPLTYRPNPSVTEIIRGWEKWKQEIRLWHTSINKPIIFTEIGYASTTYAPMYPWEGGKQGNAATDVQAKCYKAFFDTVWGCSWLAGVYWWRWDTNINAGGEHNRQFTPQNKPAQKILEAHYKAGTV